MTRGASNIIIINVQYFKVVAFCTKRPHVPKGGTFRQTALCTNICSVNFFLHSPQTLEFSRSEVTLTCSQYVYTARTHPCVCQTMYICYHLIIKIQCLYNMVFTGGHYFYYEWCWSTIHSEGISESNMSTVAVIDGGMFFAVSL